MNCLRRNLVAHPFHLIGRTTHRLALMAAAGCSAIAAGQAPDPVAAGDDEAATVLAGELPAAADAPRIFGVEEAPEIDGVLEEIWKDGTLLADDHDVEILKLERVGLVALVGVENAVCCRAHWSKCLRKIHG